MNASIWIFIATFCYAIWIFIGVFWLRRRKVNILKRLDDGKMTNDDIVRNFGTTDEEVKTLIRDGRIFMGIGIAIGIALFILK
jgi:hypothetical protein